MLKNPPASQCGGFILNSFYDPSIPVSDWQFNINLSIVFQYGKKVLGTDFYNDKEGNITFLGQKLDYSRKLNDEHYPIGRDLILNQFRHTFQSLDKVRNYNAELFTRIKRKFLKLNTPDNLNGFLVELYLAVLLIENNLDFVWRDRPDFTVEYDGCSLFLEATSATRVLPPTTDLRKKILERYNDKNKKDYAAKNGVLFIDYTNIIFESGLNEDLTQYENLISYIEPRIKDSKFGSVILCHTYSDLEDHRLHIGFNPIFCEDADAKIIDFVKFFFSKSERNQSGLSFLPKIIL